MKIYCNAGLKELNHQDFVVKSLDKCSSFKRTHCFLLQAWEALYRQMLHTYLNQSNPNELIASVKLILTSAVQESRTPHHLMLRLEALIKDANAHTAFKNLTEQLANGDDTWKLWMHFMLNDCYSYLACI